MDHLRYTHRGFSDYKINEQMYMMFLIKHDYDFFFQSESLREELLYMH